MFAKARLRLTVWYLFFLALILGGFDLGVAGLMSRSLTATLTNELQAKSAQVVGAVVDVGGETYFNRQALGNDPSWNDVLLYVTTPAGNVIQSTNTVSSPVLPVNASINTAMQGQGGFSTVGRSPSQFLVFTQPVYRRGLAAAGAGQVIGVVEVARSTSAVNSAMGNLVYHLAVASGLALALAFFAGLWLAGKALEPIRANIAHQKQFVSDSSHELRTPVTVIRAAAESILRSREPLPTRVRELAEDIVTESSQLGSLVADLGLLSQLDSGRAQLERRALDAAELFTQVEQSTQLLAESGGHPLEVRGQASGTIDGDPVRLRQLFGILVDNAVKYSPPGAPIGLSMETVGGRLQVAVSDRGSGIPQKDMARIFERFYRGDADRQLEGSGLGLAIARWIVDAHGGQISVRSEVGAGSEFLVWLPVTAANVPTAQAPG